MARSRLRCSGCPRRASSACGHFGDYDFHEKAATRVGVHYTHSLEDKQSQPGTDSIENSQIRLTTAASIFTPNLFAAGTSVESVRYDMTP
jgi:hypothetical protein